MHVIYFFFQLTNLDSGLKDELVLNTCCRVKGLNRWWILSSSPRLAVIPLVEI